jgi:hypothetical protein
MKKLTTILISFGLAGSLIAAEAPVAKQVSKPETKPKAEAEAKAEAAKPARKSAGYPFRGKVGAVDATKWTLTVTTKNTKKVLPVSKKAKIVKNGKPAKLTDGKVGEEVAGYVKRLEGDKIEVTSIRFGPKPKAQAKEPKATTTATKAKPASAGD